MKLCVSLVVFLVCSTMGYALTVVEDIGGWNVRFYSDVDRSSVADMLAIGADWNMGVSDVRIYDDRRFCGGFEGLYNLERNSISMCVLSDEVFVHELAHNVQYWLGGVNRSHVHDEFFCFYFELLLNDTGVEERYNYDRHCAPWLFDSYYR